MLNSKQIDLAEKLLVNTANVVLATLILGHLLAKGFNLLIFAVGCILFLVAILLAFWLRQKGEK